jgi:serine/threonine-protein kinase HipA
VVDRLTAWLYGTPILTLTPSDNLRISLDWNPAGAERWGLGSRILSVSLPLGVPLPVRDNTALDFLENLLPEGPALDTMARLAMVNRADTLGILASFGRDCAGAIMLLPDGEMPPGPGDQTYTPWTPDELARAIRNLGSNPFGADPERGFRPSLPGYQRKLVTGRSDDGTWQMPEGGAPSTWVLKPDGVTAMARNEMSCLDLAAGCGLTVPDHELITVDDRLILAIRRYDRTQSGETYVRIHQEDGCQATGTPPAWKYEDDGGPSLRSLASIIRDYGEPDDVLELLRRATFNVAVANTDAHAKNFSFLHGNQDVNVRLAPVYDVICTIALEATDDHGLPVKASTKMGQRVSGVSDVEEVTKADLVDEAVAWRVRKATAARVVNEMIDAIQDTLPGLDGDERALSVIKHRVSQLAARQPGVAVVADRQFDVTWIRRPGRPTALTAMYAVGEGKPVRHQTYPRLSALKAGVWRTLEQLYPNEVLDVRFKERP